MVDLHVALCYPNTYRIGMTGLTIQLLYAMFNARGDVLCERVFMGRRGIPPISLESMQPLSKFDVLAFSFQYELDYVNALMMLRDAGIPVRRDNRDAEKPILMAGGPAVTANPTVLSDFFDLFIIGDWEPISDRVIRCLIELGVNRKNLESLEEIVGVYLPTLNQSGVKRSWIRSLDDCPHPTAQLLPKVGRWDPMSPIFGSCFSMEAVRSCDRGCCYCLACWIGRPKRERSLKKLDAILEDAKKYTPVPKISLIGAGVSDHSQLKEIPSLVSSKGFQLSVPSLRVESISQEIAHAIVKGGQRTVSLAPESASLALRRSIGKDMDEDSLLEASKILYESGVKKLKLYFLIGLPGEEERDVMLIPGLARRILKTGFSEVVLSVNPFVPKPHTPFQREHFADIDYLRKCHRLISSSTRTRLIRVEGTDPKYAQIQAVLSVGGPEVGKVVESVSLHGPSLGIWRRAFKEFGLPPQGLLDSRLHKTDPLPWDFINMKVT